MNLLEVNDLRKTYSSGFFSKKETEVLTGVDLVLKQNETVAIVGKSGCGKSTMAKILAFIIEKTSGQIIYDGIDTSKIEKADKKAIHKQIQMIFQNPQTSLNPRNKIKFSLLEPIKIHNMPLNNDEYKVQCELLERVRLRDEVLERYPHELSGGQLQRICLARVFSLNPKIIIADEMISMLDVSVGASILNILKEYQSETGAGVLFVSHDLSVIKEIADRAYIMLNGEVVEEGTIKALFDNAIHPYSKELIENIDVKLTRSATSFSKLHEMANYDSEIRVKSSELKVVSKDHKVRDLEVYRKDIKIL